MEISKVKKQMRAFEGHLVTTKYIELETAKGYSRSLSIALRRMRKYRPCLEDIIEHITWMTEKKYSYSHITNTMLAIEHYMEFKGNPIKLGRPRKPKRILKDLLTESEVSRLIFEANGCIRKKAMIALLAYSGIRSVEFCNLKLCDVDLGANEIHVLGGKNRKDRITNISSECTNILIQYLNEFPRDQSDYLFTTLRKGNQLRSGDLRKHIKTLAAKANLRKRVYPHLMRHSLASNLLHRGANIILVKNQLGHAFLETTMLYIQSMSYRQKSEYDYFKPAYI